MKIPVLTRALVFLAIEIMILVNLFQASSTLQVYKSPFRQFVGLFSSPKAEGKVSGPLLDRSLILGKNYLVANQKLEGNFNYEYNFLSQKMSTSDNVVRQAGTLWGLALLHKEFKSRETAEAVRKGLDFFISHSREVKADQKFIVYPGDTEGHTGAVALVALALIEYIPYEKEFGQKIRYKIELEKYLDFLMACQIETGQFHDSYSVGDGRAYGPMSPYSSGEILLAFVKAAHALGMGRYKGLAVDSANRMFTENFVEILKQKKDKDTIKGFYQWGTMAYYELCLAGGPHAKKYARWGIDLSAWILKAYPIATAVNNVGAVHEGLVTGWELARLAKDKHAMDRFGNVLAVGLPRMMALQVGSSAQNNYLKKHPTQDPLAVGGAIRKSHDPRLRIDITQHQINATRLAQHFIYQRSGLRRFFSPFF